MAKPLSGRTLPIASTNVGRVVGGIGALACVLCCVSIPSVVVLISTLGLSFLRNDRLLFPAEAISIGILVLTFLRSRKRHRRTAPLVFLVNVQCGDASRKALAGTPSSAAQSESGISPTKGRLPSD